MAGRLIAQARKMGIDIPTLSTRPKSARELLTEAVYSRARAEQLSREEGALESDEELGKLGRLGLRHIATSGIRESNRLKANMALVAISAKREQEAPLVSLVLNGRTSEEMERMEAEARAVLGEGRSE